MSDRRDRGDVLLDQRRTSRLPLRFDVRCALEHASFGGTARTLTLHGIFVETDEAVPSGTSLEPALYLPDGEGAPAKVGAEVRRPARRRDDPPELWADVRLDEHVEDRIGAVLDVARQGASGSG